MSRLQVFKGIAVAISQATTDIVKAVMTCSNGDCGYTHDINFYEMGQLNKSGKCPQCEKGTLLMTDTELHDVQTITLHDMNDAKSFATSVQASLKCVISQDLTNKIEIGDSVIVTGIQRLDLDDPRSKSLWRDKVKSNEYYIQLDYILF